MEDGILTDSLGRTVNFKNSLIVMTSNLGSEAGKAEHLGFLPQGKDTRVLEALRAHFRPEFLGRIDKIAVFQPLRPDTLRQIAQHQLELLCQRAAQHGLRLRMDGELADRLARQDDASGARQVRRALQSLVENPLSDFLLLNPPGSKAVHVSWDSRLDHASFSLERH